MLLSLTQSLRRAAQLFPSHEALVFGSRRLNYGELANRVGRLAAGLCSLGVRPGDCVAIQSANSDAYVECVLAVLWAGAFACPLNTRWHAKEASKALAAARPVALIVDQPQAAEINSVAAHLGTAMIFVGSGPRPAGMHLHDKLAESSAVSDRAAGGDSLAFLIFTGGTTGSPKGVMISHASLASASLSMSAMACGTGARLLHVVPLFHMAGLQMLFNHMIGGGAHIVTDKFDAAKILNTIRAENITDIMAVPSMLQALVICRSKAFCALPSLERIFYGASSITTAALNSALDAFPEVRFIQGYGMTETCLVVMLARTRRSNAEGSQAESVPAGVPVPSVDLILVDESDREVPRGTTGEILVRGPMTMRGYWEEPDLTASVLRGGWMHTGDMGSMDKDGVLTIVDRIKDMIVTGGENVYSTEVENVLSQHPAVLQVAVIGLPSEQWGESVHAVVVQRLGAAVTEAALQAHCRLYIAGYKCPRSVEFVVELPFSAAGKVLKHLLRSR